jgi:transposase
MTFELRRTLSYARFCTLKQLARDTIGSEDPTLTYLLKKALELYHTMDDQITEVQRLIEQTYSQLDSHIHTISGIGIQSAACILAEYESIDRFDNSNQMLAFAGLEPSRKQSGESESKGKMVKHGSPYLRQSLMNVSAFIIIHNPILYEYYRKKRNEGKLHRVALTHVAKRIVRIIFHLEKHHLDFDLAKMR